MTRKVVHAVTGEVAEVEFDNGRAYILAKDGRVQFRPERGDWNYLTMGAPLTAVQKGQVAHAADSALRQAMGERVADRAWVDLRTEQIVGWVDGSVPMHGVRLKLYNAVRAVLEDLEVEP